MISIRLKFFVIGCAVSALMLGSAAAQQAKERTEQTEFGGEYAGLTPRQKGLIDDFYRRFSELTGIELDSEETYNQARLSSRTTYEAVTHALGRTNLTDENGGALGTALDLVQYIETVHGKIRSARGDHQFRMYVRLKPGAVEILNRSQEFSRGIDNFVYHKGYPLNYRQNGGVPSIQFSVTTDLERADIDVDYRSAKFPAVLFNGHLTASNSDVRSGNNLDRHNGRWEGFVNWWRSLFRRPLSRETYDDEVAEQYSIPAAPRAGKEQINVAVHDFLTSWLVEEKPFLATAYLSERALECMALQGSDEQPFDYGMAPYEMILRLKAINDELGKVERLADVVTGVRLRDPALTLVRQKHHAEFVLYGVQEDLAATFDCANRNKIGKPPELKNAPRGANFEDFDYFGSTFYLERPKGRGETLALLWAKEEGYWKIVSYEVEPHGVSDENTMPDIRPTMETPEMERVAGDTELAAATESFLEAWLVEKNIDKTLGYFTPNSFPCVNFYLDPGEAAKATLAEQRSRIRFALARTTEYLGSISRLEDIIGAVELFVPDIRVMTHDREEAYSLYSLPDWRGENARCVARREGVQSAPPEGSPPSYGRFYVSGMRIETVAGETVALLLGWIKEGAAWRIYAYKVAEL